MARLNYEISAYSQSTIGASRSLGFNVYSNWTGQPRYRKYLVGSNTSVIPFTYMSLNSSGYYSVQPITNNVSDGQWVIEYQDDAIQVVLAVVSIMPVASSCFNQQSGNYHESGGQIKFGVTNDKVYSRFSINYTNIDAIPYNRTCSLSVDGGTTFKNYDSNGYVEFLDSEIPNLQIPILIMRRNNNGCIMEPYEDIYIAPPAYTPLVVTETHTNTTSIAGSDGTITLIPSGGSGNYSFLWENGSTNQNRSGLVAGTYSVTVTDLVTAEAANLTIAITDPAPTIIEGTTLDVPFMNSNICGTTN